MNTDLRQTESPLDSEALCWTLFRPYLQLLTCQIEYGRYLIRMASLIDILVNSYLGNP